MNPRTDHAQAQPIGLGIYRISEDAGRSARGKLHSDSNQRETIEAIAAAHGVRLLPDFIDETNVKSDTPIELRPYGDAIKRVESGEVQVIIFAYRSRHDRSIVEGSEAITRMDRAGGVLLAGGTVLTHATPDKWAEATMGSFMSEWQKRQIAHSIAKGLKTAVGKGRIPYPSVPLGFILNDDHTARLADESVQRIVREAFALRDAGGTLVEVRQFLAANGHVRSYQSIRRFLASPLMIGEIRFGGTTKPDGTVTPLYVNTEPGFDPIVDRDVWERVQKMTVRSGRHAKSERLLARLDLVRCGGCGGRMIAGSNHSPNGKRNTFYRCGKGKHNGCPARAVIHAERLEEWVIDCAATELADAEERESAVGEARDAAAVALRAEEAAEVAEERFMTLPPGTHERAAAKVAELRKQATKERARADHLGRVLGSVDVLDAATVLRDPTAPAIAKRGLITGALANVTVAPGRAPFEERVSFEPLRAAPANLSA